MSRGYLLKNWVFNQQLFLAQLLLHIPTRFPPFWWNNLNILNDDSDGETQLNFKSDLYLSYYNLSSNKNIKLHLNNM